MRPHFPRDLIFPMSRSATLRELADRLHRNLTTPEEKAEFIRLVTEQQDVEVLKKLFSVNYDYAGTVLQRITELVPDDPKAYLGLALWKYNNGLDDEALDLFEKARKLTPRDRELLRADLWFSFSGGTEAILDKCRVLLDAFPDDRWGRNIYKQTRIHGKLSELESPDWHNPWLDLMNRVWQSGQGSGLGLHCGDGRKGSPPHPSVSRLTTRR
jgi:tetratricopeptide (TPR) repeat protein